MLEVLTETVGIKAWAYILAVAMYFLLGILAGYLSGRDDERRKWKGMIRARCDVAAGDIVESYMQDGRYYKGKDGRWYIDH